ncbi:4'-phosphopantetheinyl transferase family protein [Tenacibaculum ovolyticum]|uniref:4'-phosphopantetheinyl transferase family protein n=1 Tax=Tenacibaculum ovolyticum TaxID=104270 RepID=UPI0004264E65|nr:4'-phosphopantetheinyl transferase superfamily protein [Tenacibaculum ovolyticum]
MKTITVISVRNHTLMPQKLWDCCLNLIPKHQHSKITKFYHWKDRQASLIGKLLLKKIAENFFGKDAFLKIKYTKYQKPYLDEEFSFNISHSGEYVVFAYTLSKEPLGIDIEKIDSKIKIKDFHSVLTAVEKNKIYKSQTPICTFYDLWTIKEAVSKADGRGLHIPLTEIKINTDHIITNTDKWFYKNILITENYKCHISTSIKKNVVNLTHMTIDNLYEKLVKTTNQN